MTSPPPAHLVGAPADAFIDNLRAVIHRRLGLARREAAAGAGRSSLRPADTIRLCEFNLTVLDLLVEANTSRSTSRARGRLAAYWRVAHTMAAAYDGLESTP